MTAAETIDGGAPFNPDDPVTVVLAMPFPVLQHGLEVMTGLFGSGLPNDHPLVGLLARARTYSEQPVSQSRFNREFSRIARWGAELEAVQSLSGFENLIQRIKSDRSGWASHLYEASVARWFLLGGCGVSFFDATNSAIPDLHVNTDAQFAAIECRRSDMLTRTERRNHAIWQPLADDLMLHIRPHVAAAFVRYYPSRDASNADRDLLIAHTKQLVKEYQQQGAPDVWTGRVEASDRSFRCSFAFTTNCDSAFDIARGEHVGVEIPDVPVAVEPTSQNFVLTLTSPPTCDRFIYVKIHSRRNSERVSHDVLQRVEKKTHQINRWRKSGDSMAAPPAVVWIHHPALADLLPEESLLLRDRISGKLKKNDNHRFDAVAAVVLTQSRLLLDKSGTLYEQWWFRVIENPHMSRLADAAFPVASLRWWEIVRRGSAYVDGASVVSAESLPTLAQG